jgi:PAS domain S-box-containing protein
MTISKTGRLLIVDDEIDTLTPLCDLLTEWGYEVAGYTSGRDALQALKKKEFDLLLTDLVMPKIDPNLVCIIITGKGTIQTAVEAMKTGAFDYVLKPIEWKTFKPILSRAMDVCRLRRSEEKYRVIIEDMTELICRWKPGEILTYVNDAYCRYFNKKPEELIGQSFITLIPEEDWDKVRSYFASLSPENPVSTYEHRVFCTNGEICWQQWTNRAFFDGKGNIIEYQSVGCDITKYKRAEEALQESEERFRRLYERVPLGYQSLDEEGRFINVNQAWLDLLGYSRDEVIGRWFGNFLAPHEIDALKERFPRFKATGTVHVDLEMVRRDNSMTGKPLV